MSQVAFTEEQKIEVLKVLIDGGTIRDVDFGLSNYETERRYRETRKRDKDFLSATNKAIRKRIAIINSGKSFLANDEKLMDKKTLEECSKKMLVLLHRHSVRFQMGVTSW